MAILTNECLEQLKNKIDLVELLSSYVQVKRAGAYYKALCPFHEEKTPSFVIQPGGLTYHCFGCGAHGDAISFLMQHQNLTFVEAVELLANRFQVILDYDQKDQNNFNKKRQLEVLASANLFFHQYLIGSDEGKKALSYLLERGIDLPFIKRFEIGLAPKNGRLLVKSLTDQKITQTEMSETAILNENGSSFFYDRITFPIKDPRGSVIAFSARLYHEGTFGGKYINSKESPIFKKSNVLYGLDESRMRLAKGKKVIIVEGQIDALRLIYLGLNATVAPLGTSLTVQHADKLKQLGVESAILVFDSDTAGLKAALKTGDLLQKKGIAAFSVLLPQDNDPDQFIRENGINKFLDLLKQKQDYLSFTLFVASKSADLNEPATKAKIIQKIAEQIREWEDPIMVYESLKKLALLAGIPESTLGVENLKIPHIYFSDKSGADKSVGSVDQYLELDLLAWLIQLGGSENKLIELAKKNISPELFQDANCQKIYQALTKAHDQDKKDILSLLIEINDINIQGIVTKLLEKKIDKEGVKVLFKEALQRMLDRNWMKKREEIKVKIQSGILSDEEAIKLAKDFDEIQKNRPLVASE